VDYLSETPLTYYAGRVAAGAVAEKYLKLAHNVEIVAFVSSVGNEHLSLPR
jgi:chorismate synthase